jgi:lysophospholipase L1-like esterase
MTKRRRSIAVDATVLAVTMLLLIPVAEILVRVVSPQTLPSQEFIRGFVLEGMYVADEHAGYRLAPEYSGKIDRNGIVTTFSTNSLGLRGDEIGEKVGVRILAFGDSFTWGWGVDQGEEWVHVVGDELRRRTSSDAIEALNAGVNGYGTENEKLLFEEMGERIQPDVVLLGFFANDYTDNLLGAHGVYTVRDGFLFDDFTHRYYQENFLARSSHLYRLVTAAWSAAHLKWFGGVPTARVGRQFTPADFDKGRELSLTHILAMRDHAASIGARFAVLWLPADVYAMARRRPEDIPLRHALQASVAEAGIPSLDLLPIVEQEQRIPGLYLPGDGHLSVRGNRVVGRAVARWLLEEGLVAAP